MVNMNYFIEKVMTFVKPFMNNELHELVSCQVVDRKIDRVAESQSAPLGIVFI